MPALRKNIPYLAIGLCLAVNARGKSHSAVAARSRSVLLAGLKTATRAGE